MPKWDGTGTHTRLCCKGEAEDRRLSRWLLVAPYETRPPSQVPSGRPHSFGPSLIDHVPRSFHVFVVCEKDSFIICMHGVLKEAIQDWRDIALATEHLLQATWLFLYFHCMELRLYLEIL
jgi:hypothetical protein